MGFPLFPTRLRSSVTNARHGRELGAAAAELAGDGGFGLLELRFQSGLRMIVGIGARVDLALGVDQGGSDRIIFIGKGFHGEDQVRGL